MLLTALERIILATNVLPKEANFVVMGLILTLRDELPFTEREIKDWEIKASGSGTSWNTEKIKEVEFKIGPVLRKVIVDALGVLDGGNKLTSDHMTLYEKFVIPPEVPGSAK